VSPSSSFTSSSLDPSAQGFNQVRMGNERERIAINDSITVLGKCIHSLARLEGGREAARRKKAAAEKRGRLIARPRHAPSVHIPWRESVLTRLLRPILDGNAAAAIVITVSPANNSHAETRATLRFGARASRVGVRPQLTVSPDDAPGAKNEASRGSSKRPGKGLSQSRRVPASVLRASVEDALDAARKRRALHEEALEKAKKAARRASARQRRSYEAHNDEELSHGMVTKARGRMHAVDGAMTLSGPVRVSPERILRETAHLSPPRRDGGFRPMTPGELQESRADAMGVLQPGVARQRAIMEDLRGHAAKESPTRAASGMRPRQQSELDQQAIRLGAADASSGAERAASDLRSALADPDMQASPELTPMHSGPSSGVASSSGAGGD